VSFTLNSCSFLVFVVKSLFNYVYDFSNPIQSVGHAVAHLVEALLYKLERSRVWFLMVSLEFFIDIILPAALWPWSRLSLQQKWVQGYFLGEKAGSAQGWQPYHLHMQIVTKLGSLKLLEPSGSDLAMQGLLYLYTSCTKKNVMITVLISVFFWATLTAVCCCGCKFTTTTAEINFVWLYLTCCHHLLQYLL
jgi:hypothetical protein